MPFNVQLNYKIYNKNNVQLNYKIYNKNAVLRVAYPKDIRFFYTNTTGTSFGSKRSVVLHGVYFVKGKALQIIKIKNLKIISVY